MSRTETERGPSEPPSKFTDRLRDAGLASTADSVDAYDAAREFFGMSATYVKMSLWQKFPDQEFPEEMSMGKIVELVMVALHECIKERGA